MMAHIQPGYTYTNHELLPPHHFLVASVHAHVRDADTTYTKKQFSGTFRDVCFLGGFPANGTWIYFPVDTRSLSYRIKATEEWMKERKMKRKTEK